MQAKFFLPEYSYVGIITKAADEREQDQLLGEVEFLADGKTEKALIEIDSCKRVRQNQENSISKICIPKGSRVMFLVKHHLGNQIKAYGLQIL